MFTENFQHEKQNKTKKNPAKFIPDTLNVCKICFAHTHGCAAWSWAGSALPPRWFIKASAPCLRNIMAPNLSLPQYCHNGNMCVVTHHNASDTIAGAPPPSLLPTQTRTCIHTRFHPMVHIHTLAPALFIGWVFRGTSSLNGRLDIFRSNNLSQVLRVASVSPAALRTTCLI